ncbi:isochorismatase family protein [Conexibacter sp. S30A1]|uniref:isochorismatase family protein n=1 Tax=Conexibacter sp. S30A1 TaxID=2937800 RepID=UPI0020108DFC|nr:isochorismatase family protein [Conexibacter sp. S30A1]
MPAGAPDEPYATGWSLYFAAQERRTEQVIRKSIDDGFGGTELASILTAHRVRSVAVCGVLSEMCVSATARSAMNLGWDVVLAHDAHATYDIPAAPGLAGSVPHTVVSRVAEWALGDNIAVTPRAADVEFETTLTNRVP